MKKGKGIERRKDGRGMKKARARREEDEKGKKE